MATFPTSPAEVGIHDVVFGVFCLVAIALTVGAQWLWIVLFDTAGLDAPVPDVVFVHLLPALTIAIAPAVIAGVYYRGRTWLDVSGVVFVASLAVSAYTVRFFGLCSGPGC